MNSPLSLAAFKTMSDDTVVFLDPQLEDDDATQWQSEEDRARLLKDEATDNLGDDDTTLIDPTQRLNPASCSGIPFWRWAFG